MYPFGSIMEKEGLPQSFRSLNWGAGGDGGDASRAGGLRQ
jgi:hypothetical protein